MSNEKSSETKNGFSIDWLIGGVLTKIGDTFDRLTGRGYKPSSSLATSELIEKLKTILDSNIKEDSESGKFVPHNINLKMQWDKFSTDSDEAIKALENELHIAAIDHINDRRYHTFAPINIEVKPDYFTNGVKILASFDKFDEENKEAAIDVTVPVLKIEGLTPPDEPIFEDNKETENFLISFESKGKQRKAELCFEIGDRKSIGRTKENNLVLDDPSVSKIHAAFVINSEGKLMLADTGSTNGTFINGKRIAYGRAYEVNDSDTVSFGTVEVLLKHLKSKTEGEQVEQNSGNFEIENENISEIFGSSKNQAKMDQLKNSNENAPEPDLFDEEFSQVSPRKEKPEETAADFEVPKETSNNDEPEPTKPGIVLDFGDQ